MLLNERARCESFKRGLSVLNALEGEFTGSGRAGQIKFKIGNVRRPGRPKRISFVRFIPKIALSVSLNIHPFHCNRTILDGGALKTSRMRKTSVLQNKLNCRANPLRTISMQLLS